MTCIREIWVQLQMQHIINLMTSKKTVACFTSAENAVYTFMLYACRTFWNCINLFFSTLYVLYSEWPLIIARGEVRQITADQGGKRWKRILVCMSMRPHVKIHFRALFFPSWMHAWSHLFLCFPQIAYSFILWTRGVEHEQLHVFGIWTSQFSHSECPLPSPKKRLCMR